MKFNELSDMMQKPEPKPDTYEAGMALNQLLKIGTHAIKIHNMIDDAAEMEAWVAKKIDLASNYVKSVHGYTAGSKAGTYDDDGMTEEKTPQEKLAIMSKIEKIKKQSKDLAGDKDSDLINRNKELLAKLVKKLHEDAGDMDALKKWLIKYSKYRGMNGDKLPFGLYMQMAQTGVPTDGMEAGEARQAIADQNPSLDPTDADAMAGAAEEIPGVDFDKADAPITNAMKSELATIMGVDAIGEEEITKAMKMLGLIKESVSEDAGEGHMSKSQLYQTAKMAIELLDMIKKGDDLEGWVQTKLNLAADYLQAVYHYEDYQKLNPYREELDGSLIQKHAGIIQKHLDEILERKCRAEDVDTKPGMMRILKKRVNEVEKEIAKENRKETNEDTVNEDPRAVGKALANLKYGKDMANAILKDVNTMSLKAKAQAYLGGVDDTIELLDQMYPKQESGILYRAGVKKYGKAGMKAIQSAAGKGASHQEIGKIKDKHLKDDEQLQEGIREWGKRLAMAGIIVAGLAGVNSINNAIDNSVPAVKAMNTALDMAQDSGNTELAKMIEKDLSDAKIRLSTGKDLGSVADLQDKYAKFMKTEGLAYESKLAVNLKQRLK